MQDQIREKVAKAEKDIKLEDIILKGLPKLEGLSKWYVVLHCYMPAGGGETNETVSNKTAHLSYNNRENKTVMR